MRNSNCNSARRQGGFAVLDAMIWLVFISGGLILRAEVDSRHDTKLRAANYGAEVREINSALQELLSTNPAFPDGVYTDLEFLRHTSCATGGTANDHYLPCQFSLDSKAIGRFFQNITITSTASAVPGVNIKISNTTFGPFQSPDGNADAALAGQVASSANGYVLAAHSPVVASVRSYYDVDLDTAVVTAVNTANAASDQWLRTDGGNFQNAHITFSLDGGGNPRSGVRNASFVEAQQFIDWDDPAFLIDPAGDSNVNNLDVNGELEMIGTGSIINRGNDLNLRSQNAAVTLGSGGGIDLNPGPNATDEVVVSGNGTLRADSIIMEDASVTHRLKEFLPNLVLKDLWIASDGQTVPKPSCVGGAAPKIIVHNGTHVSQLEPSFGAGGNDIHDGGWFIRDVIAVDNAGASWRMDWFRQNSGARIQGTRVVATYCDYSSILNNPAL